MRSIVARDVMTPEVLTVEESLTISELASFLMSHEITGAVVRDANGTEVGVVSVTDVASAASSGGDEISRDHKRPDFYVRGWEESLAEEELTGLHLDEDGVRVRDVMNPEIYSVDADTPISEVAETMLKGHLHRLLVTEGDELVGLISTSDLLGLLVEGRGQSESG